MAQPAAPRAGTRNINCKLAWASLQLLLVRIDCELAMAKSARENVELRKENVSEKSVVDQTSVTQGAH